MAGTNLNLQVTDEFILTLSDDLDVKDDPNNIVKKHPKVGLWVGVAGDIKVTYVGGGTVTRNFEAGYHAVALIKVFATGTTATGINAIILG